MRAGVVVALAIAVSRAGAPAFAEPRLEASAFVGLDWFGDSELGNSWAPEQVPGTAPVLGGRIGWLAVPHLFDRGSVHGELAFEGELAIATAFTGGTSFGDSARMSYFAPVFGWRAHAMLRARFDRVPRASVHAIAGAGGATVASSSPFMSKETDPIAYGGLGAQLELTDGWRLRLDLRQGVMPGRTSDATSTFELQLGLATAFGLAGKRVAARPPTPPPPPPEVATPDDRDRDGDGLPDRLDRCPDERETVNGLDDADGCPETDPDGDGLIGEADVCPDGAEDFDRFEDEDGCPELDNDRDGIEDARDVCPNEPETGNGFADDDGCPDAVPADITQVLAAAGALRFEAGRARVTPAAKRILQRIHALLQSHPELRIVVVGHPEQHAAGDLAKRRAEAVKWDLVDQGVTEDRIDTSIGGLGKPAITLVLAPGRR